MQAVYTTTDPQAQVQDETTREDSLREVEVEREVEPSHEQLTRTEVREVEQAISVQRLQGMDVTQGESLEPDLEDIMPLTEILRPSLALMGRTTKPSTQMIWLK